MSATSTKNIPTTDEVSNAEPGDNGTPDTASLNGPPDAPTLNGPPDAVVESGTPDHATVNRAPDAALLNGPPDAPTLNSALDAAALNGPPANALLDNSTPHGTSALADSSVPGETALPDNNPVLSARDILPQEAAFTQETVLQETHPQGAWQPVLSTPPHMIPQHGLRLRMKVWTDPQTRKRYLLPVAFMRDLVRGQPVTDVMYSYAVADGETRTILLTAHEWNSLPFFYFQENGHAPRGAARHIP